MQSASNLFLAFIDLPLWQLRNVRFARDAPMLDRLHAEGRVGLREIGA